MTQWTLTTNAFGRIFNNQLVVEINDAGIRADSDGEVSFFKWEELDSAPSIKTSITGGCLSFSVKGRHYHFSMLNYFLPFKFPQKVLENITSSPSTTLYIASTGVIIPS